MTVTRENGALPISEIANKLSVPKPQMTPLINHLVEIGMIERRPHMNDRRIREIALTEKGLKMLLLCEESLVSNIRKKLSHLDREDLKVLSVSLEKLRDIGTRWEKRKKGEKWDSPIRL